MHKKQFVRIFYCMKLSTLKKNQRGWVAYLPEDGFVKERLSRLGLAVGEKVVLLATSCGGRTYLVRTNQAEFLLSVSVADKVGVFSAEDGEAVKMRREKVFAEGKK